jgi:DNA polymerase
MDRAFPSDAAGNRRPHPRFAPVAHAGTLVLVQAQDASEFVPDRRSLSALARAAAGCRGCELYENATQTVFGSGPKSARFVLVGEQPGDVEDREGEPFVGPAGRVLDRALRDAGIARDAVYLTNAVKHFRFERAERGKRRLHKRPDARHVRACHPWLAAELGVVEPDVIVALGATAAQALFGTGFRLTQHRGERLPWPPAKGPYCGDDATVEYARATLHPSAVLRGDPDSRQDRYDGLVADLRLLAE